MYQLLNKVEIPISKEIESLINIVRHTTIHKGDIGKDKDGWINFYLLDELIREIILRLVEYEGPRESSILLKEK